MAASQTVGADGRGSVAITTTADDYWCQGVTFGVASQPSGLSCSGDASNGLTCDVGTAGGSWSVQLVATDSSGATFTSTTSQSLTWAAKDTLQDCAASVQYLGNNAYTGRSQDVFAMQLKVDMGACAPYSLQIEPRDTTPLQTPCPLESVASYSSAAQYIAPSCPMNGPKDLYGENG